jgi:hypothetical protein
MKNLLKTLLILGSISWIACEKSAVTEDVSGIEGTWTLVDITGGITGGGYEANFDAIRFDKTNFDLLKNKSSIYHGSYVLTPNSTEPDSFKITSAPTLVDGFLNIQEKKITIEKSGKLVLTEHCCDLYTYEFSKSDNQ